MSLRNKVYSGGARSLQEEKKVSLSKACSLLDISRQCVYQREKRGTTRQAELDHDALFDYLREERLLVKLKRSYTKTTKTTGTG